MQDTGYVESEEDVVKRARRTHTHLEKTEHDRMRKAAAGHPGLHKMKEDPMMLLRSACTPLVLLDFLCACVRENRDSPTNVLERFLLAERLIPSLQSIWACLHYFITSENLPSF